MAFLFAEGTEILEGARASFLEEPYLRFAGGWSWAEGISVGGWALNCLLFSYLLVTGGSGSG